MNVQKLIISSVLFIVTESKHWGVAGCVLECYLVFGTFLPEFICIQMLGRLHLSFALSWVCYTNALSPNMPPCGPYRNYQPSLSCPDNGKRLSVTSQRGRFLHFSARGSPACRWDTWWPPMEWVTCGAIYSLVWTSTCWATHRRKLRNLASSPGIQPPWWLRDLEIHSLSVDCVWRRFAYPWSEGSSRGLWVNHPTSRDLNPFGSEVCDPTEPDQCKVAFAGVLCGGTQKVVPKQDSWRFELLWHC